MTDQGQTPCQSCGTMNRAGRKFCSNCGSSMAAGCPSCGAPLEPDDKFCGDCGARLDGSATPAAQPSPREAELRQVSVVFCDLVGYTDLSESRDAEDVRDLLSGYFETAHRVVGRYGGAVEKFIGDAVMAVWGSPVAREDDAERAVRAALDLVTEVARYGESVGLPGLQARAGVVTGEAASIADPREGLVVGDRVNTASRVQATAEPGTVFVDPATKEVTVAAIAYADAGVHSLKGKAEPVQLWRAVRVVGSVGGAERIDGLEAAFVGRARELVLIRELFHGSGEERRARLVSVIGQAGVGKSRLKWELEKYLDGVATLVRWHSGRCLSYGDGVAYWALAQMVRQRLGVDEEDGNDAAAEKLAAGLEKWVPDAAAREFIAPRVGVLLGTSNEKMGAEDLFAGWRLLFEQLAAEHQVVLVFEDMQWADAGLLDFIEQLLDWSAEHPIFILTLSRPELLERRADWASGRRNATSIYLDPLPEPVMLELLDDLVPGLPASVGATIIDKAEGVPLYAVETIRMLVDRDVVVPRDGVYTLVGEVGSLDVPATLSALIRARLDALEPAERSLVKDLAVLGTTFPRSAVAAVADVEAGGVQLDALLASLVRKEVLAVRSDPLSAERGQYAFVQGLLRTVAYERLSRHDRKIRHLRVATHLRSAFENDGEDVSEVVAAHYRDALEAGPSDPDADEIRRHAVQMFCRAAARGASVGAPEAALQAYLVAIEMSVDEAEIASLTGKAAAMARLAARMDLGVDLYERAIAAHEAAGRDAEVIRLSEGYANLMGQSGRLEAAITWQRDVLSRIAPEDPNRAAFVLSLARSEVFSGEMIGGYERIDEAMRLAQDYELHEVLAQAAATKALWAQTNNRPVEAQQLFRWALEMYGDDGPLREVLTARINRGDALLQSDLPGARDDFEKVMGLASRSGDRGGESIAIANLMLLEILRGDWDSAEERGRALLGRRSSFHQDRMLVHAGIAHLGALRGRLDEAEEHAGELAPWRDSDDVQNATIEPAVRALISASRGDTGDALETAAPAVRTAARVLGLRSESVRTGWPVAVGAALDLDDLTEAESLVALVADRPVGHIPPYLRAMLARFRGRVAAAKGDGSEAERHFSDAIAQFQALEYPYWVAWAHADLGEYLVSRGRSAEARPVLTSAARTSSSLTALPQLDRINRALDRAGVAAESV